MENDQEQMNVAKLTITIIVCILLLAGSVYAAYRYSQKQASNIVLPGGVTYLGPSPTPTFFLKPSPTPNRFKADASVTWKNYTGKIYPYTFSYPSTLIVVVFPDDPTDSVALSWDNIPPQLNILLNMEFIDKRDPNLTTQPKVEYVKNWYKFFSGLKGVSKVETFTNTNGLKGYKAYYINLSNDTPNVDVFFEIPGNNTTMIHLANGILDSGIFDRILDSLKWKQ